MEIFFKKLIANISFLIMRVLDGFFSLFKVYTGLENIGIKNDDSVVAEQMDIVTYFTENDVVMQAFYWILIISVFLLFVFTVAGTVKNVVTNKKSVTKVVAQFGGALLAFFLTMIVFAGVVLIGNTVLIEIDSALVGGKNLTISQQIIDLSVNSDGWREDKEGKKYSAENFILPTTADEFFGKYEEGLVGFEKSSDYVTEVNEETGEEEGYYKNDTYLKKSGGMADLYQTNLFLLFFVPLIMFILIFITLITLAKRVFEIVFLYLTMPISISTIPFDDGAKFKIWRETTFSKLFSVYGTVIAINLYLIFLSLMNNLTVMNGGTEATSWINIMFKFIFMTGGALAASGGSALFGQLIGATPDTGKNLGQTLYTGMMMAQAGRGIAHGITGAIFGHKGGGLGGNGKRGGGLLRGIGKALDTGAKFVAGNAYTGLKTKASNGINSLKETLKGGWMKNNGLIGTMNKPFRDFAQRNDLKDLIGEANELREGMTGGKK